MEKSAEAFRTISEVAEILQTPAHVLRFWESRFPQIKPVKRAGGRRYYRPSDVALISGIRRLLHDDGMTIRGVQKILREQGIRHVAGMGYIGDEATLAIVEDDEIYTAEVHEFPTRPPADQASGWTFAPDLPDLVETRPTIAEQAEEDLEAALAAGAGDGSAALQRAERLRIEQIVQPYDLPQGQIRAVPCTASEMIVRLRALQIGQLNMRESKEILGHLTALRARIATSFT